MHFFTHQCPARGARHGALAVLASLALALAAAPGSAPAAERVDVDLATKIILKVLLLDKELESKTDSRVVIGVIGSDAAYRAFTSLKGQRIDDSQSFRVAEVVRYDSIPGSAERPTLLFVGRSADPEQVLAYTRRRKVLSVTNVSDYVERGVTVGVTVEDNRPKVLVNLVGAESEGVKWSPKILKIAKTIR